MADYKQPQLGQGSAIVRTRDGALVPFDTSNRDYRDYLAWRAIPGNTPDPADPAPPPDPIWAADQETLASFPTPAQVVSALNQIDADLVTLNGPLTLALAGPILRRTVQNQRAIIRALSVLVKRQL
jgi:hypothetical protein